LTIVGVNPCPTTTIFDQVVPELEPVVQGNTYTPHTFSVWPPVDFVGYANAGEYGVDRCGSKSFTLKDENNETVDWVSITPDGSLKVQPGLDLAVKTHEITLVITLDDYLSTDSLPIKAETTI
jgi:hypothetical protein